MNIHTILRNAVQASIAAVTAIAVPVRAIVLPWTIYFNYRENSTYSIQDGPEHSPEIDAAVENFMATNTNFTRIDSGSTATLLTTLCSYDCSDTMAISGDGDKTNYIPEICFLKLYGAVNSFVETLSDNELHQLQDMCNKGAESEAS